MSLGRRSAVLLLLLLALDAAADDAAPWCPPAHPGDPRAPGCLALDLIRRANLADNYELNCLSIFYCADSLAAHRSALCPTEGDFGRAISEVRARGGDVALASLEQACWNSVETTWEQRERAAVQTRHRASGRSPPLRPEQPDDPVYTDSQYAAWTSDHAARTQPADRYMVRLENDSFGPDGTDRGYTMGLSISEIREGWPSGGWAQRPLLRGLDGINRLLGVDDDGIDATATTWWRLGSMDYTPKRIKVEAPQFDDIPFASLVFFSAGYSEQDGPVVFDSSFELGVLGTVVGREVQTAIHKVCCQKNIPKGWNHQIGEGGSPTFLYHLKWSRAVVANTLRSGWSYELRPAVGGELGYYTRGLAGAVFYLAASPADLGRVQGGFLPGSETAPPAGGTAAGERGSGFSLWFEYEGSTFAHNELLQGAWSGRNDVTHSLGDLERYVWRTSVGVELTFLERLINPWHPRGGRLYVASHVRSRELIDGPVGIHTWGGIYYGWGF